MRKRTITLWHKITRMNTQWKAYFIVVLSLFSALAATAQSYTDTPTNLTAKAQSTADTHSRLATSAIAHGDTLRSDTDAPDYTDSLSVTVYFPCGSSDIAKMPDNLNSLGLFIQQLDSVAQKYIINPLSLILTSSTSPEGSLNINRKLSHRRGQSALDYLNAHSETFRAISSSTQCQKEELTTNHLRSSTSQTKYRSMRYAKMTLHISGEAKDKAGETMEPQRVETPCDSLPVQTDTIPASAAIDYASDELPDSLVVSPILFVKTNLLYDLLTCLNISVEVPLTDRLTIEGTYVNPWWRNVSHHKTLQIRYGAITPRYYFKRSDYTSLFAGLTVGTGKYDLQWTRRGVQGSLWTVAPTFGYSHFIGKNWKMEYSASVGYLQTTYCKYTQVDDTKYGDIKVKDYPWVSHQLKTVFPVSLNVSIVYTFNRTKHIKRHEQ